jgi:hypothetical protein
VLGDQAAQLTDHQLVPAQLQLKVGACLQGIEPGLFEAHRHIAQRRPRVTAQCRTPPQVEGLAQQRGGLGELVIPLGLGCLCDQMGEHLAVQLTVGHLEEITRRFGHDR